MTTRTLPPLSVEDLETLEKTFARMQPDGSWDVPVWLMELRVPYGTPPVPGFYVIDWSDYGLTLGTACP